MTLHTDALHRIAEALVERETITGDDLNLLIEGKPLPAAEAARSASRSASAKPGKTGGSDFSFEVQGKGQNEAGAGNAGRPTPPQGSKDAQSSQGSQDSQGPQGPRD